MVSINGIECRGGLQRKLHPTNSSNHQPQATKERYKMALDPTRRIGVLDEDRFYSSDTREYPRQNA
jgi:hypothetical protein